MNKINHKPAQDIICKIILRIKEQIKAAETYRQQKTTIETDTRMSREYQETRLKDLMQTYLAGLNETRGFIIENLESIAELEEGNEKILDFDVPEFSETLAAINAAKGKLPEEVIFGIRDKFNGNYQVLLTIVSAFENWGIDLAKYKYNDYITPAAVIIVKLIADAENIETSEVSSFISLRELLHNIVHFGECRGMIFSDEFKTLDSELETVAKELLARQAMGLAE